MIKIKNAIARTIKNLGKLCAFAILILPAFAICCLLGSWTIDQNGNLIGENLINPNNVNITSDRITLTKNNNQTYTLKAQAIGQYASFGTWGTFNLIQGKTYYIKFYNYTNNVNSQIQAYFEYNEGRYYENFTPNNNQNYNLFMRIAPEFVGEITLQITLSDKVLEKWEPYGIYYSQANYNNMETAKYNEGYAEGYTNGYNQATEDVINQYAIPIIESNQIQQVVMYALNASDENAGRISFSINQNANTNTLELWNINTISGTTKNVIEIILINNLQITEFISSEGFYAVLLGNQRITPSYDGTNYIINEDILMQTQVVNIIKIEINTNVRAINIKLKGSNLSIDGTKNAYESGKEIGKQQQADEDQATISQLQTQYNTLLDHYNNAQLENPLSKMVIAVADIPLNLFHSMFNFDIMGFNLAAFILGIITILLVAYVIKLFL